MTAGRDPPGKYLEYRVDLFENRAILTKQGKFGGGKRSGSVGAGLRCVPEQFSGQSFREAGRTSPGRGGQPRLAAADGGRYRGKIYL